MSQALTLARPYARAAFSLAKDAGRLSPWSNMLGFAAQASAVPGVMAAMSSPKVLASQLVDLLLPPGDTDPTFVRFLETLQYATQNTNHYAEWYRPYLVGGFHHSHKDGNLRVDQTARATSALLACLEHVWK